MNEPPVLGKPIERVDGTAKVMGKAVYTADFRPEAMTHGVLIQSTIAAGRVLEIDTSRAESAPGVIGVLTSRNAPALRPIPEELTKEGVPGESRIPLQDDKVHRQGDLLGVVIAETFEQARYAASLVRIRYETDEPRTDLRREQDKAFRPQIWGGRVKLQDQIGDVEQALSAAPAERKIEFTYGTPIENHNPIELAAALAAWDGPDRLTVHVSTRGVDLTRKVVSSVFGLSPENVQIICPYLGGHFGSKGFSWGYFLVTIAAAQLVKRPLRLALSRPTMFDSLGQRAQTLQTIALAADENGHLTALKHETLTHSSADYNYTEPCGSLTRLLYACPNVAIGHRLVNLNYPTPCPMRAPGETPGIYALECAMDDLATQLKMDPLEIRLRNYAEQDEFNRKPWSSKHLRECYETAANRFGWASRKGAPGSMRDKDGRLVGWGMATAIYPAGQQPAAARIAVREDGGVTVQSATHESGTGTYTAMTQIVADTLGLPIAKVRFELGDTNFPMAPVNGGSWLTSSVGPAVLAACEALRTKLIAVARNSGAFEGVPDGELVLRGGYLTTGHGLAASHESPVQVSFADLITKNRGGPIVVEGSATAPASLEKLATFSFGAIFVEVKVDPDLGEIRVSRVVGAYNVGRILNPMLVRSQLIGGITMGIGAALLEATIPDLKTGRMVNANLAEYHVPVSTDFPPEFTIELLDVPDQNLNSLGVRGVGEIGIVGTPAAVANAVYHATGKRVRDLPITVDKVI